MEKTNDVKNRIGEMEFFNFDFLGDCGRNSSDDMPPRIVKKVRKRKAKKVFKIKHEKRF